MTPKQYSKLIRHYIKRSYDPSLSERDKCFLVRKACKLIDQRPSVLNR